MNRVIKILRDPFKVFPALGSRYFLKWMPDKLYQTLYFRGMIGKWPNLKKPTTYNEKLQWLKLYNRKPEYINLVDKYKVRQYVANKVGDEILIPLLGVWDSFDEIDFSVLPSKFVLKCTHDSGSVLLCNNKQDFDFELAKKKLDKSMQKNYFWYSREWPYKNVKPRIIAESFMVDESGYELKDYKFFCFDGVPKALFIATDRAVIGQETKFDFYDMNFNHLDIINGHVNSNKRISCPKSFEKMKEISSKLSEGIPHVRVDLYEINGHIYFGEMTFSHWGGLCPFQPEKWDYIFGSWISLPDRRISK